MLHSTNRAVPTVLEANKSDFVTSKILVIDDRDSIIAIIKSTLVTAGFAVSAFKNGKEAIAFLDTCCPDLILCGIQLPSIEGLAILKAVRDQPTTITTPFVFVMSANTDIKMVRRYMHAGANDCLPEPLSRQDLLATVHGCLQYQHQLEQQASQQLDQLRHNLTVALPHELRTPLQGIITSAELLSEYWDTLNRQDIQEITENISSSANRLNELIQKFLLYTQLDIASHQPENFNKWYSTVAGASELLITSLAETIAEKYGRRQDLVLNLCTAAIAIAEKWLSTLVEELVDNAFKFSDDQEEQVSQTVNITSRIRNDRWEIQVRDHGRGLTQAQIQNLGAYMQFDRLQFEQQGAGLGLAIAERIVKIYNGSMTINSTVNQGTTVTVSLPLKDENEIENDLIIG
ncbi:MAG: ATP-binding protein [Limnothrix sp.]